MWVLVWVPSVPSLPPSLPPFPPCLPPSLRPSPIQVCGSSSPRWQSSAMLCSRKGGQRQNAHSTTVAVSVIPIRDATLVVADTSVTYTPHTHTHGRTCRASSSCSCSRMADGLHTAGTWLPGFGTGVHHTCRQQQHQQQGRGPTCLLCLCLHPISSAHNTQCNTSRSSPDPAQYTQMHTHGQVARCKQHQSQQP